MSKNLYVDESGLAYIGDNSTRLFLMSAIVISPEDINLSNKLFQSWREKYLVDPMSSFHSVDFFEDYVSNFKKIELKNVPTFNKSVEELIEILSKIQFSARIFYVDKLALRKSLNIKRPPVVVPRRQAKYREYRDKLDKYNDYINEKHSHSKHLPLDLVLRNLLDYYLKIIESKNIVGSINIESNHQSDSKVLQFISTYEKRINIENSVKDIKFLTKASLESGIELADLVAYISYQTLREKYGLNQELENISENSMKQINLLKKVFEKMILEIIQCV